MQNHGMASMYLEEKRGSAPLSLSAERAQTRQKLVAFRQALRTSKRKHVNHQRSIIQAIQSAQAPDGMTTKIIAIDGPGGAGKSSFAEQLSHHLGNAPILHTDDFASWENPLNWWPRLLGQVLEPLSHNETACHQRYDWGTKRLAEWHEVQPVEYLLLEGVSSSREAFRPYIALSIWIETPRQERLRRGLERDGEAARRQWEEWMAREEEYIEREHPEQKADLVINGTQPYDLSAFFSG
jgi:uridine kinase